MEVRKQQKAANAQIKKEKQALMNQKKALAMIAKSSTNRTATAKERNLNLSHVCSSCNISQPARFRD